MHRAEQMLKEFHEAYDVPVIDTPHLPDEERRELRRKLITEEFKEYMKGERKNDLVNIAQELADLIYVCVGAALEYGIPIAAVFAEVHRANMSKLGEDGKPIYREDGKVLKGPNFEPANIAKIIAEKMYGSP